MDLRSGGSSPSFPSIKYNAYAYLVNHINILTLTKYRWAIIKITKKSFRLLLVLRKCGVLNSSILVSKSKSLIKISPFVYKKSSFFKGIKLISTPSKSFTIKLKALHIIQKSLGGSLLLLETSKGIITHKEALRLKISGRLLCSLS